MRLLIFSALLVLLLGCTGQGPVEDAADNSSAVQNDSSKNDSANDSAIVGGEKDEHGCIGSAGYSWCELRNECIRVWETPCRLTLEDALRLARSSDCMGEGSVSGDGAFFNNNSGTWWLTLEANKTGCNPACVVYENGSAEINWRCTGLIE